MKKIITYEVYGEIFDYEPTALCFEATMVLRAMLTKDAYEGREPMTYTDEQVKILLSLIVTQYEQYQVPVESIVSDWRNGRIDFSSLTVNQIRCSIEDKMNDFI